MKRFPYVIYSARSVHDESPTWSRGRYEGSVGHYVKYPREFEAASSYATVIRSRADWESGAWVDFAPTRAASRPVSPLLRLRYRCERAYYRIVSSLKRPRRVERLAASCKRALRRTIGRPARDRR